MGMRAIMDKVTWNSHHLWEHLPKYENFLLLVKRMWSDVTFWIWYKGIEFNQINKSIIAMRPVIIDPSLTPFPHFSNVISDIINSDIDNVHAHVFELQIYLHLNILCDFLHWWPDRRGSLIAILQVISRCSFCLDIGLICIYNVLLVADSKTAKCEITQIWESLGSPCMLKK